MVCLWKGRKLFTKACRCHEIERDVYVSTGMSSAALATREGAQSQGCDPCGQGHCWRTSSCALAWCMGKDAVVVQELVIPLVFHHFFLMLPGMTNVSLFCR